MSKLFAIGRIAFAALALALFAPGLYAQSERAGEKRPAGPRAEAGNPEIGLFIIVGAIGFFILVAWLFSRTMDDGGRGPDRTLL